MNAWLGKSANGAGIAGKIKSEEVAHK